MTHVCAELPQSALLRNDGGTLPRTKGAGTAGLEAVGNDAGVATQRAHEDGLQHGTHDLRHADGGGTNQSDSGGICAWRPSGRSAGSIAAGKTSRCQRARARHKVSSMTPRTPGTGFRRSRGQRNARQGRVHEMEHELFWRELCGPPHTATRGGTGGVSRGSRRHEHDAPPSRARTAGGERARVKGAPSATPAGGIYPKAGRDRAGA